MTAQDIIQNDKFALLCGQTHPKRETTMGYGEALILKHHSLTKAQARYWQAAQRKLVGKVDLIDPARESLKGLRARFPKGTRVYRASTGGKWGKCLLHRYLVIIHVIVDSRIRRASVHT